MRNKIEFPWPPKEEARPCIDRGCNLPLEITFHPPSKRRGDLDNQLASIKAGIDGLAAALYMDDRDFYPIKLLRGEPVKGGKVIMCF